MEIKQFQRVLRCPIHKCQIGKYDVRHGLINATFYCEKCKAEYTFTICAKKIQKNT